MRDSLRAMVIGGLLAGLAIGSAAGRADDARSLSADLFGIDAPVPERFATGPGVVRVRAAAAGVEAFAGAGVGAVLRLRLFEDVAVRVVVQDAIDRDGLRVLKGRVEGDEAGAMTAVVRDGWLSAMVETRGRVYRIRSAGAGTQVVSEIVPEGLPRCAAGVDVGAFEDDDAAMADGGACDDGSTIDVLVLFTPVAMNAAGGQFQLLSEINLAFSLTNAAYIGSGIDTRLNIVHVAQTSYLENGSYSDHLSRLRGNGDGFMDEVHALRNEHAADLVALIVNDGEYCGIAYRMQTLSPGFASSGFSVTTWYCAASSRTLAHEIGHNQGCCHDHDNDCGGPIYSYAFGHRFFGNGGNQYRTVMSYAPGARIGRFSNPGVFFDGQPTGVASGSNAANNAQTLNNTDFTVANFRCSPNECPADIDGSGVVGLSDLLAVLSAWGPCFGCDEDLDGDNVVGFTDLVSLLGAWGPCD